MKPLRMGWRAALRALERWSDHGTGGPGASERPRVLAIATDAPLRLALERATAECDCTLAFTDGSGVCDWLLREDAPPIVILDRRLASLCWRDVVHAFARKTCRPYVILLAPNTDANLWDELERAGGSDLLRTPVGPVELAAALAKARQLWSAGRRLRPSATALTK